MKLLEVEQIIRRVMVWKHLKRADNTEVVDDFRWLHFIFDHQVAAGALLFVCVIILVRLTI